MELTAKEQNSIYWRGAIDGAIKGIPQGILLGVIGFGLLVGSIYAVQAIGLAGVTTWMMNGLGGFLFQQGSYTVAATAGTAVIPPAFNLAALSPLPFIALNAVLTIVGNFLTGGTQAVAEAKQQKQNDYLDAKLMQVEGREQQIEQVVSRRLVHEHTPAPTPRHVQHILEEGPRVKVDKPREEHASDIVADRLEAAERTLH